MKINEYGGYFHDGSIIEIKHMNNKMEILMESSQLDIDWIEEVVIPVSKKNTLKGKLHIENIKCIREDGKTISTIIKEYDDGDIYDFEIIDNKVILIVSWINYPPKPLEETRCFKYEIEAEKIHWENIPNL